jgi:predicted membrane protein
MSERLTMTSFINRRTLTLGTAFALPCITAVALVASETTITASTYAIVGALLTATAAVAFNTWRNGQATAGMAQLLHETEVTASARDGRMADDRRVP